MNDIIKKSKNWINYLKDLEKINSKKILLKTSITFETMSVTLNGPSGIRFFKYLREKIWMLTYYIFLKTYELYKLLATIYMWFKSFTVKFDD